jgi:hypothetical protein
MNDQIAEQITVAIGAHGQWKSRLKTAIDTGRSDISPVVVRDDHRCPFGCWLHALPAPYCTSEYFRQVRALHATFHQEAAAVLEIALAGNQAAAHERISFSSPFAAASAKLTSAMVRWRSAAVAAA